MNNMPPVTKNLLIINVLMFAATYVLGLRGIDFDSMFALHFFLAKDFMPHQFVTYLFMHGGWEHLFFNMFALWMFGRIIEQVFGAKRFLIYYFVCGIGAGVLQELVQYIDYFWRGLSQYPLDSLISPGRTLSEGLNSWRTVGASGAIYGILLAFGMSFPNEKIFIFPIPIPIKAKFFVIGYAGIELFSALLRSSDGVAHMAHLGGMLFGLLLILHWRNPHWCERWTAELTERWRDLRKPRMKVIRGGGGSKHQQDMDYNARRKAQDEEIDRILDKVKRHGYGCLSEAEKQKLFNASGRR